MADDSLRWPPRTAAFNPLDPGDAEICWLFDQWKDAVSMGLWGQAAEYRQMYLSMIERRDVLRRRAQAHAAKTRPPDPA